MAGSTLNLDLKISLKQEKKKKKKNYKHVDMEDIKINTRPKFHSHTFEQQNRESTLTQGHR